MSNLYDLASFPVKSVINSLQMLKTTTTEAEQKTEPVSHGSNEKVIKSNNVRIRLVALINYNHIDIFYAFVTKY